MIGPAKGEELTLTNTDPNATVAIFFDGTDNNMYNTDEGQKYNKIKNESLTQSSLQEDVEELEDKVRMLFGDSYENDYSNVARLFKNYRDDKYPNHYRIYIDGIGTLRFHGDDIIDGTGLGSGKHGIKERAKDACKEIVNTLAPKNSKTKIVDVLTIDVFGFSRGAAAARHFVYEITSSYVDKKPAQIPAFGSTPAIGTQQIKYDAINPSQQSIGLKNYGYLSECCGTRLIINKIVIRFAGLFDTVASYSEKIIWNTFTQTDPKDAPKPFTDDVKELNLNVIENKALRIVHLTSGDEHRANFPLTNIKTAKANGRGIELVFPGVHSDVGGSYQDKADEEMERLMQISIKEGSSEEIAEASKKLNTIKDMLIQQGWYQADELHIHKKLGGDNLFYYQRCLHAKRKALRNTYSFIPLHIMCKFAVEYDKKNPLPFDLDDLERKSYPVSNDPLLVRIKDRLVKYAFQNGDPIELISTQRREIVEDEPTPTNSSIQYSLQDKTFVQQQALSPLELLPQGDDGDLLSLRRSYLHWSANFDRAKLRVIPNYPRIIDNDGNTQRLILEG